MVDRWSKINGFENYSVSDSGQVRNDKKQNIKKPVLDKDGYLKVDLYNNGKRSTQRVHRLVGEAFIDNPKEKKQINHKDGNKTNNNVSNLEWVTSKENVEHSISNGLFIPSRGMLGKKNPNAGRPGKSIRVIETGEIFDSIVSCEKAISGNNRHICDCLSGRQKTHRGYHFEYVN